MLILGIIATVAAIAAPRYANALTNYHADAIARRIAADLDRARATAQATSARVTVNFEVAANRYGIPAVPSLNNPAVPVRVELGQDPYNARLLGANFGGDGAVEFDGYGAPDTGGWVIVACGSSQRTVVLDLQSGIASAQAP